MKPKEGNDHSTIFGTRFRFAILPLVLLCLSFTWANILSFNLATICLNKPTFNETEAIYRISNEEQTLAIAAMAVGAVVSTFPVILLVGRIGSRIVFTVLGFVTAIATILIPLAIENGFNWLCLCRMFQGVAFAANYPVIGAFTANWTYHKQTGLFVSILACYIQVAPIFSNGVGGILCDTLGWSSIYYLHGWITFALFTSYWLVFRNNPRTHPFVGEIEAEKIGRGKPSGKTTKIEVPLGAIMKTPAIWAVWIAAIGNFVISDIFFVFTPIYLAEALHFSASKSGFSAMYPPLAQLFIKIIIGYTSDKIKFLSDTCKFRLFNSISFMGSAVVVVVLAFMEDHHVKANSPVIALALAVLGINAGGFYKAGPYLSKQYSHVVTGIMSQCNCIVLLVIPFAVHAVAPENTVEQWKIVFLVVAAVLVFTNILFVVLIRGEPCEWTKEASFAKQNTVHNVKEQPKIMEQEKPAIENSQEV